MAIKKDTLDQLLSGRDPNIRVYPLSSGFVSAAKLSRRSSTLTKHLRVLESAGVVRSVRSGRESLFEFEVEPIEQIKTYLDLVLDQWDQALARLKSFVEV